MRTFVGRAALSPNTVSSSRAHVQACSYTRALNLAPAGSTVLQISYILAEDELNLWGGANLDAAA